MLIFFKGFVFKTVLFMNNILIELYNVMYNVYKTLKLLVIDVLVSDARRIEVVANGLPLWHGAQLAIDATIVCACWLDTVLPASRHRCARLRALAGCRGGLGCSLLPRCEPTRLLCSSSHPLVRPALRVRRRDCMNSSRMCGADSP